MAPFLLALYLIGFVVCLPIAYRWCSKDGDYADWSTNLTYNGSGALGFALVWFMFLPALYFARITATK